MRLAQRFLCRAWLLGGSFAASIGAAPRVSAEEARPEAIHLRFEVEERLVSQCPDRVRFVELLIAERPRLSLAPDGANARSFNVRIRREPKKGLAGEVVISELDGAASTRSVAARDCRTLVRALAVVTAVASDVAPTGEEPPAHEEPPAGEEPPAVDTPPIVERPPPSPPAPARETSRRRPPGASRPTPSIALGAGAGTELVLGALPRATMGYRGYVEGQRRLGALDGGVRASFAFARAQLPGTSQLNVFVQTWTARLEGCASRRLLAPISVEACLGATAGAYHSYSDGVEARDDVRPWLTVGPGLRTRWHVGRGFHAELFGNVSYVPTVYATVVRDHIAVSHEVPRGIGEIGLGFGHSFDLQ